LSTDYKKIVCRYYYEVLNKRNYELIDVLFDENFKSHLSNGIDLDLAIYKKSIVATFSSLENIEVIINDQIAENEKVVTRWTAKGTLIKPFAGINEVGKKIEVSAIHIHKIKGNKIIDHWEAINLHTIQIK
jgi:predicted ester cyclase